jgi:endonuclease III
MTRPPADLAPILDRLEAAQGPVVSPAPADPYAMLVWLNCGYPASDEACAKGYAALVGGIGAQPSAILAADSAALAALLRLGGMVPELRAQRLKAIARVVAEEFGGDLAAALVGPVAQAKRRLKRFATIGESGAERILLFTGLAPEPAVPANALQVLARLGFAQEGKDFNAAYRSAREAVRAGVAEDIAARQRAYLLIKRHGKQVCRGSQPLCPVCPVADVCAYARRASA